MKRKDISRELDEYKQQVPLIRAKMDELVQESKEAMPKITAEWMEHEVKWLIKNNSKMVEKWDSEKMTQLKGKVKGLTASLQEIVDDEFGREEWPHHDESNWGDQPGFGRINTGFIDSIFRRVISRLGNILDEYGFFDFSGKYPSWTREGEKGFRYSISLELDKKPGLKIAEYDQMFGEYMRLGYQIRNCEKRLSEAKAEEMWDEA